MYYQVKLVAKEKVRFPAKSYHITVHQALRTLFDIGGEETYLLIEKYVRDAFEAEDLEELTGFLNTFAKRAEPEEIKHLMEMVTEDHWSEFVESPTKLNRLVMEHASAYWYLNNIFADAIPEQLSPIDVWALEVKITAEGDEYPLFTQEDTRKYGEIYPFATRLIMDATSGEGEIGEYELKGPIVEYFEGLKKTKKKAVPSDEPYDYREWVDDVEGVVWAAEVIQEPETNDDGEEEAVYRFLVHPEWVSGDFKSEFKTYAFSEYD